MAGKKLDEQMEKTIRNNYRRLTGCLVDRKLTITTMESITCGQIASLITDTEGASAILKGAFVTYSNEAKIMQGVPEAVIETCGVYSKETARAMAEACKQAYRADIGIGITGTTGNIDPNNQDSVPGEVYYAIALSDQVIDGYFRMGEQDSRLYYKLYAAEMVVEKIGEVLGFEVDRMMV